MKQRRRHVLSVILMAVMLAVSALMPVYAESPSLISGTAADWIDRIDLTNHPYAKEFYDKLVEAADNDGQDDFLIDDSYFENGTIAVTSFSETENDFDTVHEYIAAAYQAFNRDHPEVFWLSGQMKTQASSSGVSDGNGGYIWTTTVEFVLKNGDFDIRSEAYRSAAAVKAAITERDNAANVILDAVKDKAVDEKIAYFNDWLTKHNEYYTGDMNAVPDSARSCVTALKGSTGENGPVCEGYSRAFKVLCDKAGIPCTLVDGKAYNSLYPNGGAHMWNLVEVEGNWYAVDVTWNDPTGGAAGAVSGYEGQEWLLVGSDTVVGGSAFSVNHQAENNVSSQGLSFTNQPVMSTSAYVRSVKTAPTVTFEAAELAVDYTGSPAAIAAPTVKVGETVIENPAITYSYSTDGATYIDGLPVNAGTYTVKASVAEGTDYLAGEGTVTLTINKIMSSIGLGSYPTQKVYDGTALPVPTAELMGISGDLYQYVTIKWYVAEGIMPGAELAGAPSAVGTYFVTASMAGAPNHIDMNVSSFVITISPKALTWNTEALSVAEKYWDGTTEAQVSGTLALSGFVGTDTADFSYELSAVYDSADEGERTVTVTVNNAVMNNGNYVLPETGSFTLTGKILPTPTTEAPTTEAPTTEAPTTEAPTTEAPTTEVPTTEAPTTEAPTTEAPTTEAPTTEAPTTEVSTTEAPTTEEPTTEVPTTEDVTTEAPTTEAPTTEASTTETPTTEAPTTEAPTTEAPTTEAPTTEASTTAAETSPEETTAATNGEIILGIEDYAPIFGMVLIIAGGLLIIVAAILLIIKRNK